MLNVMGAIFVSAMFLGTSNSSTVQPVFAIERSVMYRWAPAPMLVQNRNTPCCQAPCDWSNICAVFCLKVLICSSHCTHGKLMKA